MLVAGRAARCRTGRRRRISYRREGSVGSNDEDRVEEGRVKEGKGGKTTGTNERANRPQAAPRGRRSIQEKQAYAVARQAAPALPFSSFPLPFLDSSLLSDTRCGWHNPVLGFENSVTGVANTTLRRDDCPSALHMSAMPQSRSVDLSYHS